MENALKVGYSRVDITPEQYTNLGGHGNDAGRLCNRIERRIFGTCVAITDAEGNTILYCPSDIIHARACLADPAREAIAEATGVPYDHIMINASHNHSGPSTSSPSLETVQIWFKHYIKQMVKCAKEAMEDRKNATILAGQREVPGMTFVRHYFVNDGTVAGPNSGSFASGVKAHLTEADNQLQVVRFCREDARDVVLVNWQCHATTAGEIDRLALSGDYITYLRDHLEGTAGVHFAFFQGAAGNLVPRSKFPEKNAIIRDVPLYGRTMAEHVVACLNENMKPLAGGKVRATKRTYTGAIDHSDDARGELASQVLEKYLQYPHEQKKEAQQLIKDSGFNSFLHAMGIARRASLGESLSFDIWALRAGELGFISAPYEMFCSSGMYIKENSPFPMTFVVSCCNNTHDYMADETSFQYDIYEVNTRRFGKGAAEELARNFVDMLSEIK